MKKKKISIILINLIIYNNNKKMKSTIIVNFVGGPGIGKSTMAHITHGILKSKHFNVEFCSEYAKDLVWDKQYNLLNNQMYVVEEQIKKMMRYIGQVDYLITDGSVLNCLWYNKYNPENTSSIKIVEEKIMNFHEQNHTINIFLTRGNFDFEAEGRIHSYQESIKIDKGLKELLKEKNINYVNIEANINSIESIIELIKNNTTF